MAAKKPRRPQTATRRNVALFVSCLVDLFRPSVGFAAVRLLKDAGCTLRVPLGQTCCGQPAYNSGDRADARAIARQVIAAFAGYDYVVVPSGSCAGMIRHHYPRLFEADDADRVRAEALAAKTYELTSFLVDVCGMESVKARCQATVAYHDSCSGLRELGVRPQPRKLLNSMDGITLKELPGADVCCGFGGTFCVKYGDVSADMAGRKTAEIRDSGADLVVAGDLGCLLNLAGRLKREGSSIAVRHVAEVLAGELSAPPIGDPAQGPS